MRVAHVNPLFVLLTVVTLIMSPDIKTNGDDGGFWNRDADENAADVKTAPLANPPVAGMRVTINAVPAAGVPDEMVICALL